MKKLPTTVAKNLSISKPKKKVSLVKQLDKICGEIVRARGICLNCGSRERLQWCHIVTRGAKQVRWSLDNAVCLCQSCHFLFTNQSWRWPTFISEHFGEDRWWDLHRRANTYEKIDHKGILEHLKQEQSNIK